jgi:hypothetical protein
MPKRYWEIPITKSLSTEVNRSISIFSIIVVNPIGCKRGFPQSSLSTGDGKDIADWVSRRPSITEQNLTCVDLDSNPVWLQTEGVLDHYR